LVVTEGDHPCVCVKALSRLFVYKRLSQRGYDYSYFNITDEAAMINELKRLGNDKAVLITTVDKGYRIEDSSVCVLLKGDSIENCPIFDLLDCCNPVQIFNHQRSWGDL
jgi:hypothetical protein